MKHMESKASTFLNRQMATVAIIKIKMVVRKITTKKMTKKMTKKSTKNKKKKDKKDDKKDDKKETGANKDAQINLDAKVLKDKKEDEITAKLEKVDQPKGDWTLTLQPGTDDEKVEKLKDKGASVTK